MLRPNPQGGDAASWTLKGAIDDKEEDEIVAPVPFLLNFTVYFFSGNVASFPNFVPPYFTVVEVVGEFVAPFLFNDIVYVVDEQEVVKVRSISPPTADGVYFPPEFISPILLLFQTHLYPSFFIFGKVI